MGVSGYDRLAELARLARRLDGPTPRLPRLIVMSDPKRSGDIIKLADDLPRDCAFILRTYGEARIEALAYDIAAMARRTGWKLLISADPELAARSGADGVHWPQWSLKQAVRPWPEALISASAHDAQALRHSQRIADAVLVSPIFASASPSATHSKGVFRLAAAARRSSLPIYGLGGLTEKTGKRLINLGVAGIACVGVATP